ncbi:MAG: hypothetical protein KAH57_00460 [Thermoplasmata archaeon]|nr:hypothetical protein [Thermoplasmata archaeon]
MDERLTPLLEIKGIGEAKIRSLISGLGGEDRLVNALQEGDVALLSTIDRLSERMAVQMVLRFRDQDVLSLLGTHGSHDVYDGIMEMVRSYMHTSYSRNRTSLLVPREGLERMMGCSRDVFSYRELLAGIDRERVEKLLNSLGRAPAPRNVRSSLNYILLVENDKVVSGLEEMGLDRRCMVISPEDAVGTIEGQMVFVYDTGEIDDRDLPVIASVPISSRPFEIVPEIALDGLYDRRDALDKVAQLREIFGEKSVAREVVTSLEALASLAGDVRTQEDIEVVLNSIKEELDDHMKSEISRMTLSGDEALTILSRDDPLVIREIYRECSVKAVRLLKERLGVSRDIFNVRYPVEIIDEEKERLIAEIKGTAEGDRFREKVELARGIRGVEASLGEEEAWCQELDYRFGLGCMVEDLSLRPFKRSEGWFGIYNGSHIALRGGEHQPVTYHLGRVAPGLAGRFPQMDLSPSRIALLTGANSGGKTTLLETIAQVIIMAHMGLPVPADEAYVPELTGLYMYKPRKNLDAGGLEGFLKDLLPLSLRVDEGAMMLADELEAMTELEAASRIIGTFMEEIGRREAYGLVVTHMAGDVSRFTDVRIDGIEAKGLDENDELIVDRTPSIGRHARSTPELILRRLRSRSSGEERELYSRILNSFDK